MSCEDVLSRWDGRNNGQDVALPPTDKRTKILEISGGSNLAPQVLTLCWSIGLSAKNEVIPGTRRSVRGYLEFGVTNITHAIAFDLGRGGAVTVTASYVSFAAEHIVPPVPTSLICTVKASLAYGSRTGSVPSELVLTDALGPIAGGSNSSTREIPAFATTLSAQGTPFRPFLLQNVEVVLFNSGGVELTRFPPSSFGIGELQRIPSEATHYRLDNVGAADLTNTSVVFGLAL